MTHEVPPIKILLDHSVRQRAVFGEHGFAVVEDQFAGKTYRYLQPQTRHTPPRTDWLQQEIDKLPGIAERIRDGILHAFTTNELYAEAFRADKFPPPAYIDVFEGCPIGHLPAPLERSKFGLGGEQFMSKDDVIAYCKSSFLTPSPERIERFIEGMKHNPRHRLSPFEERCLRKTPVFQKLCRGIDETHYPDALHLWTAEENGLDAFLTLDKKFRNVVERQDVNFTCRVL